MTTNLTPKMHDVLRHMWSCWFARSMTLGDFSKATVSALEGRGLITWDAERDNGPLPPYGLTHQGFAMCEKLFGPRKKAADDCPKGERQ